MPDTVPIFQIIHNRCNICNKKFKRNVLSAENREGHIAGGQHKRALKKLRQGIKGRARAARLFRQSKLLDKIKSKNSVGINIRNSKPKVKHSNSKPKVSQSTNNSTFFQDVRTVSISIDDILPHFILIVSGFINEIFARDERICNWISIDLKNLISLIYAKPVIISVKYDKQMKSILYCPVNEKPIFVVELNFALNKMSHFSDVDKIGQKILCMIEKYFQTKHQMDIMITIILQRTIQCKTCSEYIKLLNDLYDYIPKMYIQSQYQWIGNKTNISKTFREIVIKQTNELFQKHCVDQKQKDKFIKVMLLIAQLYKSGLISANIVRNGIFMPLLSPQNVHVKEIDVEGLCFLLKHCGAKLDKEVKKSVDKYLKMLMNDAKNISLETQEFVEELVWIRNHNWVYNYGELCKAKANRRRNRKRAKANRKRAKSKGFWWIVEYDLE